MSPLLVGLLVASSTFAALWPVWGAPRDADGRRGRRITVVRTDLPVSGRGCASLRKRAVPRRRF